MRPGKHVVFWVGLILTSSGSLFGEDPSLVLNPKSLDARYKLAAGVSYTGAQLRYHFTPQWAAEARAQFGSAKSNYGDVNATVIGFRGYRFIPYRHKLAWYFGGEAAHASADAENTDYRVDGFAVGAFGGMEYRVFPRLAVGMDIGPYMISLKEKQTGLTQTNLDFVVNTSVNFYLF